MKNIIMIDNKPYSINRIKELVEDYDITVYEARNSYDTFNVLQKLNDDVGLIITDVNLGKESGIDIIRKLKERGIKCPILILTSESKRKTFIEGIKAGASDYILRPFDEKVLLKRIVKDIEANSNSSKITEKVPKAEPKKSSQNNGVDFNEYLSKTMNNANKGISFSLLMLTLFKSVDEFTEEVEKEYNYLTKKVYPKLQNLFSEADVFTKHGPQGFVAVFKNLKPEKEVELTTKIKELFEEEKKASKTHDDYFLEFAFGRYPEEGRNKNELLEKVQDKVVEKISVIKRMEK